MLRIHICHLTELINLLLYLKHPRHILIIFQTFLELSNKSLCGLVRFWPPFSRIIMCFTDFMVDSLDHLVTEYLWHEVRFNTLFSHKPCLRIYVVFRRYDVVVWRHLHLTTTSMVSFFCYRPRVILAVVVAILKEHMICFNLISSWTRALLFIHIFNIYFGHAEAISDRIIQNDCLAILMVAPKEPSLSQVLCLLLTLKLLIFIR